MGLQVELEPAGQPPPGAGCFSRVDDTKADRVGRTSLRQQWQVRRDHGRDHRVAAARLVIDVQDDQPARRGDLYAAGGHRYREDLLRLQTQPRRFQAQTHTVDRGRHKTRGRAEALERVTGEGIGLRPRHNPDLPGATDGQPVRWRPWLSFWFVADRLTGGESITGCQGSAEAPAERPELTEGPAAEHGRNGDPTPNRHVGPSARCDRSAGQGRAAAHPYCSPVSERGDLTTRDGDDAISVEAECGASGRAFD